MNVGKRITEKTKHRNKGKFASEFPQKYVLSESHFATSFALTGASNGGVKPLAKSKLSQSTCLETIRKGQISFPTYIEAITIY